MFNKTMSDWLEALDSDRPTSDGDCANAWSPAVWNDTPAPQAAHQTAHASAQGNRSRNARADRFMGGTPNHG